MCLSLVGLVFWLIFILNRRRIRVSLRLATVGKACPDRFRRNRDLRIIVFMATSEADRLAERIIRFAPASTLLGSFHCPYGSSSGIPLFQVLPFIVLSPVVALLTALLFFYPIERLGRTYSISSLPLFKAFIANWVTGANAPLEKFFEDMGEDTDIEVNILKFESSRPKAAIIVPFVHPGPFKNIGSSLLPSMMKHEFQKEVNCEACTPLGHFGA